MVTENSLLDMIEDITDYTLIIFLSISKSSIITELLNVIQDRFDKKNGPVAHFFGLAGAHSKKRTEAQEGKKLQLN